MSHTPGPGEPRGHPVDPDPNLLKTLEQVERWMSGYGTATQSEMREVVRAAIAEHRGSSAAPITLMPNTDINRQTPGPVVLDNSITYWLFTADNKPICTMPLGGWRGRHIQEANAHLLAAAYTAFDRAGRTLGLDAAELAGRIDLAEMIQALEALLHQCEYMGAPEDHKDMRAARAAVAKARGKGGGCG